MMLKPPAPADVGVPDVWAGRTASSHLPHHSLSPVRASGSTHLEATGGQHHLHHLPHQHQHQRQHCLRHNSVNGTESPSSSVFPPPSPPSFSSSSPSPPLPQPRHQSPQHHHIHDDDDHDQTKASESVADVSRCCSSDGLCSDTQHHCQQNHHQLQHQTDGHLQRHQHPHQYHQHLRHPDDDGEEGRGGSVTSTERPMKRLMTYVKTVLRRARARLLWSRRCLRCQFSFLTISDSSSVADEVSHANDYHDDYDDVWSVSEGDVWSERDGGGGVYDARREEDTDCLVVTSADFSGGQGQGTGCSCSNRTLCKLRETCERRMSRVTLVSLLWSLLSLVVAGACAFSFCHPNWITHPDRLHSFGLFTQCVRNPGTPHPSAVCYGYGADGGVGVASIPAGAWQASTLLFGSGVCLQGVGAVVTLILLLLPSHPYSGRRLALLCGYLQILAVLLLLSGLVMFPLGFSTDFFRYYCDSSGAFCVGHCRLGWGYVLAITSTALAIFCPVLSNYTDVTLHKEDDHTPHADLVTDL